MPPMKTSYSASQTVNTTNATKTLLLSFDMSVAPLQARFDLKVIARDSNGNEVFSSWKFGGVQRVGSTVSLSTAPADVQGPTLLGLLAGLLSTVGVTFEVSGTTVNVYVTGKASTALVWRGRINVMYN